MFLISTRNFPPDVGGIQNLMEGLSNALLNHGPVKVIADNTENSKDYEPVVVVKRNNHKPLVIVDAEYFVGLHKGDIST